MCDSWSASDKVDEGFTFQTMIDDICEEKVIMMRYWSVMKTVVLSVLLFFTACMIVNAYHLHKVIKENNFITQCESDGHSVQNCKAIYEQQQEKRSNERKPAI